MYNTDKSLLLKRIGLLFPLCLHSSITSNIILSIMVIYDHRFFGDYTHCSICGFTEKTAKIEIAVFVGRVPSMSAEEHFFRPLMMLSQASPKHLSSRTPFTAHCETE